MLRVHFTSEDLTRVRVAPGPDFLWEITNSVQTLQRRDGAREFDAWRRWARPRLSGGRTLLAGLLPPRGYSPDFLTPTSGDRASLQAALDVLLSTPHPRLRTDLSQLATSLRLPGWVRSLAAGDTDALRRLGTALHTYQLEALAPYWARIRAHVDADRAVRLCSLLDRGTEGLLGGLGPQFRWRHPVLEVSYPVDQHLHLLGRGLVLQPSFFCWPTPTTLADGALPPVLVYPIHHAADWARPAPDAPPNEGSGPLGPLLGHTRAGVLRATLTGCSTVEAARLLQVTHPAVSQHVNVLRAAGLITTVRTAGRSLHVATAEGRALLAAEGRAVPPPTERGAAGLHR
ncbi:winged helix-turn-helix domain-containing protein [Streptomyces sp. NBC_01696]|uniref:ArsR family transcriptional regulator n=1 Tax=Streptomyces sp. gb1(2016) TaxID=1828321 RepID=A0A652KUL4_9ACTN|nr:MULTISPECIES: winged helix-turn-helix domain-containing protein [unclassified Streptomyces]TXS27399.1 ArsR family transcriptional regulator [Streptomyces sp. gb1(2016)]